MNEGTIALIVMSTSIFLIFLGFFLWGLKTGQFRNVEEPKYRMFRNEKTGKRKEEKKKGETDKGSKHNKGGP